MSVWLVVVTLAAWAGSVGVHPRTAYAWVGAGRMRVPFRRLLSGTISPASGRYPQGDVAAIGEQCVVLYARVCSHDQGGDLARQVARLTGWATDAGLGVGLWAAPACGEVGGEVGSGLTGKCSKLAQILSDPAAIVIVMEHRDRLARLETQPLSAALAAHGCGARNRAMRAASAAKGEPGQGP